MQVLILGMGHVCEAVLDALAGVMQACRFKRETRSLC